MKIMNRAVRVGYRRYVVSSTIVDMLYQIINRAVRVGYPRHVVSSLLICYTK